MPRKPNSLLTEFLNKSIDMPEINWETVPRDVNLADAWDMYDETVEALLKKMNIEHRTSNIEC